MHKLLAEVKTIQETLRRLPLVADPDALEVLMEDDELLVVAKPAGTKHAEAQCEARI